IRKTYCQIICQCQHFMLSVSIMNFLASTSQVKLIPNTIPTMVHIADKPVKKVKPVKPNISQEDSLVALSEKASAQPGNSLPPNKNLERFIFCLPKNKPTPTMSKKYNIISIIIIVSKHIPPLKSAYKKYSIKTQNVTAVIYSGVNYFSYHFERMITTPFQKYG